MNSSTILGFSIFGIIVVAIIGIVLLVLLGYISIPRLLTTIELPFFFLKDLFLNNDPVVLSDICSLFPGMRENSPRVPSYYMSHIAFFFGFLFTNAYVVYNLPVDNTISSNINNRKFRALMTMIILGILYFIIATLRFTLTGCESLLGIVFTSVLFGLLGNGWYKFAEMCGARNADILGIASSFVSPSASSAPLVCESSSS